MFGVLLILYAYSAWRIDPVSNFGVEGDDAVYFASAKALASGQGYILPSFPVRLAATRYPEFYPLLLAGIWKLDPHFPGNVNWAVAMTLVFGCAALIFAFLLLRRWPEFGDWDALGVVALCAFSALFLDLSASVLTDVPFMALMLGAIWLAERSVDLTGRPGGGSKPLGQTRPYKLQFTAPSAADWAVLGAGVLAGVSIGFRTLGAAVVAGIGLVLLTRRQFRKLVWFSLAAAPIAVVMVWPQLIALVHPRAMPLPINQGGNGWTQTLCYYTSYACELRMDVSGPAVLWAVVKANLQRTAIEPGLFLLFPFEASRTIESFILLVVVSVTSWAGIVRYVRKAKWSALLVIFLLYLGVLTAWPYTMDRLLVPFLPLFFGGLWLEGRHLAMLVRKTLLSSHTVAERTIAAGTALAALTVCGVVGVNYFYSIPTAVAGLASANRSQLEAERSAFAWIRKRAAPDARIISSRGELTYLYTGRQAVLPIIGSTAGFYENNSRYGERAAAHLTDIARNIHASYWMLLPDDFSSSGNSAGLQARELQLLADRPRVFRSEDGAVQIFDVRCLTGAMRTGCEPNAAGGKSRDAK